VEILYSENPEVWDEMAIPEEIESFAYGSTDGPFMFVSIRPKKGGEVIFSAVPTFLFLIFRAKWEALKGGITTGSSLKS
jgi:hypothetical protein